MRDNRGSEASPKSPPPEIDEVPFGSNDIRLTTGQWIVTGCVILALLHLIPVVWKQFETFDPGPEYRIPYSLGNDYWMYDRYYKEACSQNKTLVIGDSVIWGHYVTKDQTLSHHLNQMAGEKQFANLGVDGIHPAALAGLIRYYGRAISGKKVILHCNLLWMSSKKHDLQTKKEFSFNHPRLVPQFFPKIPCYTESFSGRIAVVIGRNLPFHGWVNHLRVAYFQDISLHLWTLEHPYGNPVLAVTTGLPSADESPSPRPVAEPWTEKRMAKFDPPWVELESSFQWRMFQHTIETLKRRKNKVFVLVGPFNEHMLKEESLETYHRMKSEVEDWLREKKIPYYIPPALPSDLYADASHPLSDGYAMLAKELFENQSFRKLNSL